MSQRSLLAKDMGIDTHHHESQNGDEHYQLNESESPMRFSEKVFKRTKNEFHKNLFQAVNALRPILFPAHQKETLQSYLRFIPGH